MYKFKTAIIAGLAMIAGNAQGATIDSFDIVARSFTGNDSNVSLELGTEYTIQVSGQFEIDGGRFADAEYFDIQTGMPRDVTGADPIIDIGVQINGVDIDWGPFASDNVYTFTSSLLSGIINLRVNDVGPGAYSDNFGSLQVEISTADVIEPPAVPLPAGLPLLAFGLMGLFGLSRKARA